MWQIVHINSSKFASQDTAISSCMCSEPTHEEFLCQENRIIVNDLTEDVRRATSKISKGVIGGKFVTL